MSARFVVTIALAVALLASAVVGAQARATHTRLTLLTNAGYGSVPLSRDIAARLRRNGVEPRATLLARRNGTAFVRVGAPPNNRCFGIKRDDVAEFGVTCWDDFPSPSHPVLDVSVFGADNGEPLHLIEADGFAADGVAAVAFTDAAGNVLGRAPVSGNVYSVPSPPRATVRIVALDARGRTVWAVPK